MEKNGVFSRVRSRWRSIFSKKSNPVKLRDGNRMSFERCILSDPDTQVMGTILAQATVEPITLPNGQGIALIQETHTIYDNKNLIDQKTTCSSSLPKNSRRFYRLSSGDLNLIRRMTEEIDVKCLNVIYDDNEITGEMDEENGVERACFKPGPSHPPDQQMVFLKQCLTNITSRPPNMYYLTQGWTVSNFEGLFKYMLKSEDCERPSFLRVEFKDCIPSLTYLNKFVREYAAMKGYRVDADYVYATVHCKRIDREKKLRGPVDLFLRIEDKVRQAHVSYLSNFIITSPSTPNVTLVARFYCVKSCLKKRVTSETGIAVQLDQMVGQKYAVLADQPKLEKIDCDCEIENTNDTMLQLTLNESFEDRTEANNETDLAPGGIRGMDETQKYFEMFPFIINLFDKSDVCDDEPLMEEPSVSNSTSRTRYFELDDSARLNSYQSSSRTSSLSSSDSILNVSDEKPQIVELTSTLPKNVTMPTLSLTSSNDSSISSEGTSDFSDDEN